ncbi:MAG: site-2 protease family protein [Deltaproteobacteria bacterium]|nr:site-2 protease family protein [Deltaproteobacteria bacterium]
MKWSWKICSLAGIPVFVHPTFFLIFAWVLLRTGTEGSWSSVTWGVLYVLALFGCVVLHELGHALMARRFGIGTRDITLLPIGGVARLERMPRDPKQELLVALAGPAVNVGIALVLLLVGTFLLPGSWPSLDSLGSDIGVSNFLPLLLLVNIFLVVFNLLPAFPMDGGRVLRALLATVTEYRKATRIAAITGQAMAVLFFLAGLWLTHPVLLLISVFVWLGAAQEARAADRSWALEGVTVRQAMVTQIQTLTPGDTLGRVVEFMLRGSQQDFPVLDELHVVGLLTRRDLLKSLASGSQLSLVSGSMRTQFPTASPDDSLEEALRRLQLSGVGATMPVLQESRLVGLLTMENASEFLMIQAALEGTTSRY